MTARSRLIGAVTRRTPQAVVDFFYRHRFHPLVRPLRGPTRWMTGDPREGVVIPRGPLAGYRLAHEDSLAMWIGGHETAVTDAIMRVLEPGQVAFDIGAHVGYTALLMAHAVGPEGRVVAFEPDPRNLELLLRNVELNGLDDRMEARAVGLGRSARHGSLARGEHTAHTQIREDDGGSVVISTLDVEVYEHGAPTPDLLLVDVEGMEEEVFAGGERLLKERGPAIILEGGPPALHERLVEGGYVAERLDIDHVLYQGGASRKSS